MVDFFYLVSALMTSWGINRVSMAKENGRPISPTTQVAAFLPADP